LEGATLPPLRAAGKLSSVFWVNSLIYFISDPKSKINAAFQISSWMNYLLLDPSRRRRSPDTPCHVRSIILTLGSIASGRPANDEGARLASGVAWRDLLISSPLLAKVQSHKSQAYPHAACDNSLVFIEKSLSF
jgi:hypothetical protein